MTETQKYWEISEPKSSKNCRHHKRVKPDMTDGKINNFGEMACEHPLGSGQVCCIKNKMLCPIRTIEDYPLNPELQVNKDDV